MMITSITMIGDSGDEHEVTVDPVTQQARCSCPAWRYAKGVKVCRHIAFLAEAFAAPDV